MHLLIVDHHDSFVHNVLQLLREAGGVSFDRIQTEGFDPGLLHQYDGLILSPGPEVPSAYPSTQSLLARATEARLPTLGICLGHQAIAEHFGAELYRLPAPLHGHASRLTGIDNRDAVVGSLPEGTIVGRYHSWAVKASTLPPSLLPTSFSHEPQEGRVVMSLRHSSLPIWGVQFHPESMITESGEQYILGFLSSIHC